MHTSSNLVAPWAAVASWPWVPAACRPTASSRFLCPSKKFALIQQNFNPSGLRPPTAVPVDHRISATSAAAAKKLHPPRWTRLLRNVKRFFFHHRWKRFRPLSMMMRIRAAGSRRCDGRRLPRFRLWRRRKTFKREMPDCLPVLLFLSGFVPAALRLLLRTKWYDETKAWGIVCEGSTRTSKTRSTV